MLYQRASSQQTASRRPGTSKQPPSSVARLWLGARCCGTLHHHACEGPGHQHFPGGCPSLAFGEKACVTFLGPVKTHPVCKASQARAVQTDLQSASLFFFFLQSFLYLYWYSALTVFRLLSAWAFIHFKEPLPPLAVDDDGLKTDGVTAYECSILFPPD